MNDYHTDPAGETADHTDHEADSGTTRQHTAELLVARENMQAIKRKHFPSTSLDAGQKYIAQAMTAAAAVGIDPVLNFDPEQDFPAGYGLAIIPLARQDAERGNVTCGLAIAAVPDFATVAENSEGKSWIEKQIIAAMIRQVAAAAKSTQITSIPYKVSDFATTSRASALAGFNHVATLFVAALKKRGLNLMSKAILRQILASAAFAEQQYPRLPQSNWVAVIDSMIKHAAADSVDTSGLEEWKKTRDAEVVDMTEVDLTDIDAMIDQAE